jgi:hypothetical protein
MVDDGLALEAIIEERIGQETLDKDYISNRIANYNLLSDKS